MKEIKDMNKDELIQYEIDLTNKLKQTSGEKRQIAIMKKIKKIKKYVNKLGAIPEEATILAFKEKTPIEKELEKEEKIEEEIEKEMPEKKSFWQRLAGRR